MFKLFVNFLEDTVKSILDYFADGALSSLLNMALYPEKSMNGISLNALSTTVMYIGISLIVLKFLRKGFDIYILWTDGDAGVDPSVLLFNFVKAMALAITFTSLYPYFVDVINELADSILAVISFKELNQSELLELMSLAGFMSVILFLVALIMYIILFIKALKTGIELMILRMGFSFACVGIMDANDGVFATYFQKFMQVAFTLVIQVGLAKLALTLIYSFNGLWGIVAITAALSTPNLLRDFMITGGNGGMGVYHAMQTGRILKGAIGGAIRK